MKAFINKIGLFDAKGKEHSVKFQQGVNVVTGRSSTGKSALFEIFNYCFGSSECNIPRGIITSNAYLYFVIFRFEDYFLVLGRKPNEKKVYIQKFKEIKDRFSYNDFKDSLFFSLKDFKYLLGDEFGLKVTDQEENPDQLMFRKKKEAPSVRHFLSFIAQPQNLIASKTQLFYGFEDSFKKAQTIEQFRIFSGFVDQSYFYERQTLNKLEKELRLLEGKEKYFSERSASEEKRLEDLLYEYQIVSGEKAEISQVGQLIASKDDILRRLNSSSEVEVEQFNSLEELINLDQLINNELWQIRELAQKIKEIETTKSISRGIVGNFNAVHFPSEENKVYKSICPFCNNPTSNLDDEANKLLDSINWLNHQLSLIPVAEQNFEVEMGDLQDKISEHKRSLNDLRLRKRELLSVSQKLKENHSLSEQVFKVIYKIEVTLESLSTFNEDFEAEKSAKIQEIEELKERIDGQYKIKERLVDAVAYLNNQINEIANTLGFEKSYKPLLFQFDIKNFELFTLKDNDRVYLKQMGSAANWLYCHLSLFMAFTRYFSYLKETALVPPILFLDQPSQVYFPSTDDSNDFEDKLEKENNKRNKTSESRSANDDLSEVENFFDQIIYFNKKTLDQTGWEPQIIITEHADHLKLKSCSFDSLVRARWRAENDGLIQSGSLTVDEKNNEVGLEEKPDS